MNKWRIHRENGWYIPQQKWLFFWIDIVLPTELFYTLKDENYSFRCTKKFDGGVPYWYRPRFISLKDAVYCTKKYDEYCKKREDEDKIEDYYLNDKYEVKEWKK
jgi:hypothetical protein